MKQEALILPRQMQEVDIAAVLRQPTMTKALVLCADMGGFASDKDFARKIGLDQTVWSRIKEGERCFPQDDYEKLFDVCANEAPLIWLADRRGYVLTPKESEMERRLRFEREAREKAEAERDLLRGLLTGRSMP